MNRWFPPAEGETPRFQPPFDGKGIAYQQRVMDAALARRSALGILPTGTGKSRCFQVPALEHHERTGDLTVVVSPLKALMEDQAAKAEEEGLPGVARLHSDLDVITRDEIPRTSARAGSPCSTSRRKASAPNRHAQCSGAGASACGSSTRRIAFQLGATAFAATIAARQNGSPNAAPAAAKRPPLLCLTATARPETQKDIQAAFKAGMGRSLAVIDGGAERPNLTYRVVPGKARPTSS